MRPFGVYGRTLTPLAVFLFVVVLAVRLFVLVLAVLLFVLVLAVLLSVLVLLIYGCGWLLSLFS